MSERHADGTFSHTVADFGAVYAEIKRLDQLRGADQVALAAALLAAKTAVDAALAAAEKAVSAALIASKEAVTKAEMAQGKTNESQNEFRGQLRDQASTFLTRAEWDLSHKALNDKLAVTNDDVADLRSRLDVGSPGLRSLQSESDQSIGRRSSTAQGWDYLLRTVAIAIGIGGLVFGILKALGG